MNKFINFKNNIFTKKSLSFLSKKSRNMLKNSFKSFTFQVNIDDQHLTILTKEEALILNEHDIKMIQYESNVINSNYLPKFMKNLTENCIYLNRLELKGWNIIYDYIKTKINDLDDNSFIYYIEALDKRDYKCNEMWELISKNSLSRTTNMDNFYKILSILKNNINDKSFWQEAVNLISNFPFETYQKLTEYFVFLNLAHVDKNDNIYQITKNKLENNEIIKLNDKEFFIIINDIILIKNFEVNNSMIINNLQDYYLKNEIKFHPSYLPLIFIQFLKISNFENNMINNKVLDLFKNFNIPSHLRRFKFYTEIMRKCRKDKELLLMLENNKISFPKNVRIFNEKNILDFENFEKHLSEILNNNKIDYLQYKIINEEFWDNNSFDLGFESTFSKYAYLKKLTYCMDE